MNSVRSQVFTRVQAYVEERLGARPDCHDWDHTLRVVANSRHLARVEQADLTVVLFAAVLHDVARADEFADSGQTCHAERGAEIVLQVLPELGESDPGFVRHVSDCVRTHRFRSRTTTGPATLEARVVYDADKLDSIGAVGIGRAFHFSGRIGSRLHNTREEALGSESYGREDSAYREFLVKLRHVPERMLTAEGRRIAWRRHGFMLSFFERLDREVCGEDF
jgi:uncharacterized protein